MIGSTALRRQTPQRSLALPPHADTHVGSLRQGRGRSPEHNHASAFLLDFPATRIMRHKICCFISYPVCGTVLQKPEWTKANTFIPLLSMTYDG